MSARNPRFALIYDTETNQWKEPHIVQIAAALFDTETRKPVAGLHLISRPQGWDITEETTEIHGITQQHAEKVGVPEEALLIAFYSLWQRADVRVAHNAPFDKRVVRLALSRFGEERDAIAWDQGVDFCTQSASRPICQIPNKKGTGTKAPKLTEAYEFFTGKEMPDAHTANGDVRGCAAVYFAILAHQEEQGLADTDPFSAAH